MTGTAIELTDAQRAISTQARTWPEQARALKIADDQTYTLAGTMLRGIKALTKEADDVFDPAVKKAHEAHKAILNAKNSVVEPLREAEKILKRGMGDYHAEQERKRLAEETRLREIAERQAAEERKRIEEERKAAIAAAALEGAAKLNAVAQQTPPPPPPAANVIVASFTPKVSGVSTRTVWKVDVFDVPALLRHVVDNAKDHPELLSWVSVNLQPLRELARDEKGETGIPGVRFVSETVVASR